MPIEFTESLFQNNDFKVTTNNDGDLVQTHQQTGAQFKFDATKDRWVPVQGLDLEGATIDNVGSIDADAVDHDSTANRTHQGDDLSPNSVDAGSVSADEADIANIAAVMGWSSGGSDATVPDSTRTKLEWDTAEINQSAVAEADTSNDEITVKKDGIYIVSTHVLWAAFSSETGISMSIFKNGSRYRRVDYQSITNDQQTTQIPANIMNLSANDTIDIRVYHSSGSDETLIKGSSASDELAAFSVGRLG